MKTKKKTEYLRVQQRCVQKTNELNMKGDLWTVRVGKVRKNFSQHISAAIKTGIHHGNRAIFTSWWKNMFYFLNGFIFVSLCLKKKQQGKWVNVPVHPWSQSHVHYLMSKKCFIFVTCIYLWFILFSSDCVCVCTALRASTASCRRCCPSWGQIKL